MNNEKNIDKREESEKITCKKANVKPGDIKGKIEVPDTRERRDGPGGD